MVRFGGRGYCDTNGVVIELRVAAQHGVAEVGQGVQPRVARFVDDFHQEKSVLAHEVVILEVDDDIFFGPVIGKPRQAFRRPIHVRLRVCGARNMDANAGRAESHGDLHPLFAVVHRHLAPGRVGVVETVPATHGDINDVRARLLHGGAEHAEVGRLRRTEVIAQGLDVAHAEFLDDHRGEVFEVHSRLLGVARPAVRGTFDHGAKRPGGHGEPVARLNREIDVGLGKERAGTRAGEDHPRRDASQGRSGGYGGGGDQKLAAGALGHFHSFARRARDPVSSREHTTSRSALLGVFAFPIRAACLIMRASLT